MCALADRNKPFCIDCGPALHWHNEPSHNSYRLWFFVRDKSIAWRFDYHASYVHIFFLISDDAASDFSSKSGTPSPILGGPRVPHGVIASRDLVRDFRESSVHSRTSSHGDHEECHLREESVPREDQASLRHPSPFNRTSNSSLGVRFEFLLGIISLNINHPGAVLQMKYNKYFQCLLFWWHRNCMLFHWE